jgi:hypothetical protein
MVASGDIVLNTDAQFSGVEPFRVKQTALDNQLVISDGIGIGTTAPASQLHIAGGVGTLSTGLSFGDGDTGFYEVVDDDVVFESNGTAHLRFSGAGIFAHNTNGFRIQSGAASSTVPAFIPNRLDTNTGIGWALEDNLSLIAGGVEAISISSGVQQFSGQAVGGSQVVTYSATPSFDFNNGNSQEIVLTGDITSWTISNELPAGSYTIWFIQDAVGGRVIPAPTGIDKKEDNSYSSFLDQANDINIVNIIVSPSGTSLWSIVGQVTA